MKRKLFVLSDIHGHYSEMKKALDEAGFDPENGSHIFVSCGDLFDRGMENVAVYDFVRGLKHKILIRGNHEDMLLNCEFVFEGGFDPFYSNLYGEKRKAYELWISNGGGFTFEALNATRRSEQKYIFEYLTKLLKYLKSNSFAFLSI